MMNLNKVTFIGNLVDDPSVTTFKSGQSVTTFGIATSYRWRDAKSKELREKVEFHQIVAHSRLGEVAGKYLKKGGRVFIEGRLEKRAWTGKDGGKRERPEVIAEQMIMLGKSAPPPRPPGHDPLCDCGE